MNDKPRCCNDKRTRPVWRLKPIWTALATLNAGTGLLNLFVGNYQVAALNAGVCALLVWQSRSMP